MWVNGQTFPVSNDYAVVNLTGLPADGEGVNLAITFTDDPLQHLPCPMPSDSTDLVPGS